MEALQAAGLAFSTTSSNYFINSSTTIIKAYGNNTWTGGNIFTASTTIGDGTQGGGLTVSGGATTTGTAYFAGSVGIATNNPSKTLDVSGTGRFDSTLTLSGSASCTGSQALQTNSQGDISCGSINVSGASSGGGWTTNNIGSITLSTTTDRVAVGATSTPYAKLVVISSNSATTTLALLPASGATANILDIYNTSGALASVLTAGHLLGLGTTSPSQALSVQGNALFSGNLFAANLTATGTLTIAGAITSTASTANTLPYASSTALSVSGTGYIGTASTTALNVSGTATLQALSSQLLSTGASGAIQSTTISTPLDFSSNTLSLNIGAGLTTNAGNLILNLNSANSWLALQQFSAGASTTALSVYNSLFVGGTATTTIRGDGTASTIPFASSTALTVSGTGYLPPRPAFLPPA
ncbi:MAG: hypothetical protein UX77_C0039G0004 [Parcubacteria group bacterium GW2011_GWA1_47_11]|nr:MAG: hypothetical protein UX77_C0039G0004 [Parcubacteria group bacterium GW2011_GWA1_47_11]